MQTFVVSAIVGEVMTFVAGFLIGRLCRRRKHSIAPGWERRLTLLPICTYHVAGSPHAAHVKTESPFEKALQLALQNGFTLIQHAQYHYQLVRIEGPKWIYNFYPSTGKIVIDPHYKGPRIHLERGWTLGDAVQAVIAAKERP